MKAVYILLMVIVVAAALGCVDKKGPETVAKIPGTPAATAAPAPTSQPSTNVAETEVLDPGNDLATMDTMANDMSLDLSFSDVSVDTLT